jgi:hypothetical protein
MSAWSGWWGPTLSEGSALERLLSRQPVAHALGELARLLWGLLLIVLPGWALPSWLTLYAAASWQLTLWEPKPDATYPLLWLALDVGVELLVALLATGIAVLLGARWPSVLDLLRSL